MALEWVEASEVEWEQVALTEWTIIRITKESREVSAQAEVELVQNQHYLHLVVWVEVINIWEVAVVMLATSNFLK